MSVLTVNYKGRILKVKIHVKMKAEAGDTVEVVGGKAHNGYRIGDQWLVRSVGNGSVRISADVGIPTEHVRVIGVEDIRAELRAAGYILDDEDKYQIVIEKCVECGRPIDPNMLSFYGKTKFNYCLNHNRE
jgi:hypothetical protein